MEREEHLSKIDELIRLYNIVIEKLFEEIESDILNNPNYTPSESKMALRNKRSQIVLGLPKTRKK
jgi:hypothetical protein